jgi:hypothetical protein
MATKKVKKFVYSASVGNPFHGVKPTVRRKKNLKR